MPRYIDADKIDFKLPCEWEHEECFVSIDDVRKAIEQTPTEDVVAVAEIERLQKYYDEMENAIGSFRKDQAEVKFFKDRIRAKAIKEFTERVNDTTWYHINAKGELVVGANGETDVPLYKAEDIYQIAKEMGVEE